MSAQDEGGMKAFAYFGAATAALIVALSLTAAANVLGASDFWQGSICGMTSIIVWDIGRKTISGRFA